MQRTKINQMRYEMKIMQVFFLMTSLSFFPSIGNSSSASDAVQDLYVTIPFTQRTSSSTVTAYVVVVNSGTTTLPAVRLDIWANSQDEGYKRCGSRGDKSLTVSKLAPGASQLFNVTGLQRAWYGYQRIVAFVDSQCRITESNEENWGYYYLSY
jgi:hypothetical protein